MSASLRARVHAQLEPTAWPGEGLSPTNRAIAALILLSVVAAILESEPTITAGREWLTRAVELVFGALFAIEYAVRLWASAEDERFGTGIRGRLRYAATPAAIFDLIALSPVLLGLAGGEAYIIRLVRLIRVLRLARLGRFSAAVRSLLEAVSERRYELLMSAVVALILLVVSSTLLYLVEGAGQPDAFGSIPRAMWWSIATLTTVGYGDVYPVTPFGKMLAGLTALTGIGIIAMPTGILAAAFSDALQRRRRTVDGSRPSRDAEQV